MYNKRQFESLIRRVLAEVSPDLVSDSAVNLLLGTAAQESKFGTYLTQVKGPALGAFQMEYATYKWLQDKYGDEYKTIKFRAFEALEYDLRLAIIMARLRYKVVPKAFPESDDLRGLANYWKDSFNTVMGAGTIEQFMDNYRLYVSKE